MLKRAILSATLVTIAGVGPATAQDDFRWSGRIDQGDQIEIKNANGPLNFEYTDGDEVVVTAVKDGPARDRAEVEIEVVEHAGGVTICAVYPDRMFSRNECLPGDEGRLSSRDNDTSVTFDVRVPAGVRTVGTTMNGRIAASAMRSDIELLTMNGAIDVETTGWASAKTMNGAVEARMGRADWSGNIELESMNGGITVRLPANASADVDAKTMNGRIRSDWDLATSGWLRNKAHGTIGSGGRGLTLSTMNGSIRIERES